MAADPPTDEDLLDFLDDQRRADAVVQRRQTYWLGRQIDAGAHLAGLLLDLGERGQMVGISTGGGRSPRGEISLLGADFCGLVSPTGALVLVAFTAIETIRPEPGTGSPVGDRIVEQAVDLGSTLAELAPDRPALSVHTNRGETITGRLRTAGPDLLSLIPDHGRSAIYVPMTAVADVAVA